MINPSFGHLSLSTSGPQECCLTGVALLQNPHFNKGSAFSQEEREIFGLTGLLPVRDNTLEDQVKRAYEQYGAHRTSLGKNTFMASLKDQNEVLYYRLIQDHLKEILPIIYTPTEGEAIANYSRIFRRPEGCFLSVANPDGIESALDMWGPPDGIDIIVCSDGEQILGIGDQGVGAVLISVAKLALYTLCAGIHPNRTLPVVLDVGTNNQELLDDSLYLGLQQPRVRGEQYDAFIDRFVCSCRKRFPKAYIHFEDFGMQNARRILDKYAGDIACFNDDVQGTGCVTLAAIYSACQIAKYNMEDLRIVLFGAGTAGIGIADQICNAIMVDNGKSKEDAVKQIWCIDKTGLLTQGQEEELTPTQREYARPDHEMQDVDKRSLFAIAQKVKPHVLIGTSAQPKAFTREVVQEMAKHVERPIIFPLSNPTKLHEATPKDILEWTDGKALTATGSPYSPVKIGNQEWEIAECNNSTIFPGIGLGVVLSRSKLVTEKLLVAATKALAAQAPSSRDSRGGLLPDVTQVREVSVEIAAAVVKQAVQDDLAQEKNIPSNDELLKDWIREQMWNANYRPLKRVVAADTAHPA